MNLTLTLPFIIHGSYEDVLLSVSLITLKAAFTPDLSDVYSQSKFLLAQMEPSGDVPPSSPPFLLF